MNLVKSYGTGETLTYTRTWIRMGFYRVLYKCNNAYAFIIVFLYFIIYLYSHLPLRHYSLQVSFSSWRGSGSSGTPDCRSGHCSFCGQSTSRCSFFLSPENKSENLSCGTEEPLRVVHKIVAQTECDCLYINKCLLSLFVVMLLFPTAHKTSTPQTRNSCTFYTAKFSPSPRSRPVIGAHMRCLSSEPGKLQSWHGPSELEQ